MTLYAEVLNALGRDNDAPSRYVPNLALLGTNEPLTEKMLPVLPCVGMVISFGSR